MIWSILDLLLQFEMNERDNKWGRKDREIKLGVRFMEESMGYDEHDEHNNFPTKENNFIS